MLNNGVIVPPQLHILIDGFEPKKNEKRPFIYSEMNWLGKNTYLAKWSESDV